MREELEKKLAADFPELFAGAKKPETQSLMCFGCECGDGWFDIIRGACSLIATHTKRMGDKITPFEFAQIKEKFGSLRLYGYGGDAYINGVIAMAETMSIHVCEITGDHGKLCTSGTWLRTLSAAEAEKHGYTPLCRKDKEKTEPQEENSH